MFEKEAKEYLTKLLKRLKIRKEDLAENLPEILSWEKMNFVSLNVSNVEKAFQRGAEFGYNKAEKELVLARGIIKKFSEFVNKEAELDPEYPEYSQELTDLWNELCEQAEQFLQEVEE